MKNIVVGKKRRISMDFKLLIMAIDHQWQGVSDNTINPRTSVEAVMEILASDVCYTEMCI